LLVAELVGGRDLPDGFLGRRVVAGVDLGDKPGTERSVLLEVIE
jgi:hypothetical protein